MLKKGSGNAYRVRLLGHSVYFAASWWYWKDTAKRMSYNVGFALVFCAVLILIPALALWRLVRREK